MRNLKILILLTFSLFGALASAEYQFGFFDININRLDWNEGTKLKSTKQDFYYLEFEGGQQHSWGELYGFFDIENIGKTGADVRTACKGSVNYYLGDTPFSLYAHVYNFTSLGFSEQNQVTGFGYRLTGKGWWVKPFIGFHNVSETFYSGFNGYMAGWVIGYGFTLLGLDFLFADWHEYEFARNQTYADGAGGSTTGQNGAASLTWNTTPHLAMGFQWRYAQDKLGTPGTLGAQIYTLKYNF
jgi:hypothetical protein